MSKQSLVEQARQNLGTDKSIKEKKEEQLDKTSKLNENDKITPSETPTSERIINNDDNVKNISMPYDQDNKYLTFPKSSKSYYVYDAYDERLQSIADEITAKVQAMNPKAKQVPKGQILDDILSEYFKGLDSK